MDREKWKTLITICLALVLGWVLGGYWAGQKYDTKAVQSVRSDQSEKGLIVVKNGRAYTFTSEAGWDTATDTAQRIYLFDVSARSRP